MLERFAATFNQEAPTASVEKKILSKFVRTTVGDLTNDVSDFIDKLTVWSDTIRRTFMDDGIAEMITTRRLVRVLEAYFIFHNRDKAIELCVNRFDDQTATSFKMLYRTVENPETGGQEPAESDDDASSDDIPF